MTQSLHSATATVYPNGGPEAALQTHPRGGKHTKPFLSTGRSTGFLDPRKRAAQGHGDHIAPGGFFSSFAQQGCQSPRGPTLPDNLRRGSELFSKTKETVLVKVATTVVPKHSLVALGVDMVLSGLV